MLSVRFKESAGGVLMGAKWLDCLAAGDGAPLVVLPATAPDGAIDTVRFGPASIPARVWRVSPERDSSMSDASERRWIRRDGPLLAADQPEERPHARIAPSNAAVDWPGLALPRLGAAHELPAAMPLLAGVAAWDALGDAVHAFLAAGRGSGAWRKKAIEFLSQLGAYAEALRRLRTKRVTSAWVHYPIGGGLVEVTLTGDAAEGAPRRS